MNPPGPPVHAYAPTVNNPVSATRAADDIVIEDGLDDDTLGRDAPSVRSRPHETLFFARQQHEDERCVEIDPALRKSPREIHREYGAAAVVVRTWSVDVVVLTRLLHRAETGRRRHWRHHSRGLSGNVQRIVMSRDVDPARTAAR